MDTLDAALIVVITIGAIMFGTFTALTISAFRDRGK